MQALSTIPGTPAVPDMTQGMERLRTRGNATIMLCAILVWMLYVVSGFRMPTTPITLSDADAGARIRQLVFSATGMLAFSRLLFTRTLATALSLRLPAIALAGLLFFSAAWSVEPTLTIKRSVIVLFGLLGLIVMVQASQRPVHVMLRTVVYFTAAASAASLIFYFSLPSSHTVNPGRPGLAGISNHPNTLAPFLSIGLLLSFGLSPKGNGESRLLLISKGALGTGLIMTGSITTLLTTLAGAAIYLFLSSKSYFRGTLQLVMVSGITLVAVIGTSTLKGYFFNATGRDESLSGRDQLWHEVGIEIKKSPVIGNGFGAFWTEGKGRELVQTWNPRQSHNAYMDVMLDLGVAGLLAVILLFQLRLMIDWRVYRGLPNSPQRRATAAMMAVAFSYMTVYAFGQSLFLRFDVFPFFILAWITLLFSNPDKNNLSSEFTSP